MSVSIKCSCGNEQGKPLVFPRPISYIDSTTRKEIKLNYNGGMCINRTDGKTCWFCLHPHDWLTDTY